ncbi:MAG: hypothetical protein RQ801_09930 [Spirochaetaceae bacterium]|nr:hypothetical protein [Spirochaetaceae bacterium]MDT8298607.1 hypothetical protein [Spirochaetaceae bacterium]
MTDTDGRREWESLLKEPIAAVAKVSFIRHKTGLDADFLRGTAVLTESRFLMFKEGVFSAIPKTEKMLRQRLRLEIPRTDITDVEQEDGVKNTYILRYIDGKERKISFRSGTEGKALIKLMEQDLSGG